MEELSTKLNLLLSDALQCDTLVILRLELGLFYVTMFDDDFEGLITCYLDKISMWWH